MILDNLHIDNYLKFEHSEVSNSTADDNTLIGATKSEDRTLDFTPDDTNSVYVSKAGNDTTGDGTAANPYLTIKQANTAVTETKCNIVIADSGTYVEESMVVNTDCARIVAAIGCTPVIQPVLVAGSGNYFSETVFPSTDLSVSTLDNLYNMQEIATLSDGNLVSTFVLSNETTACFIITDKNGNIIVSQTTITTDCHYRKVAVAALRNDTFVVIWNNGSFDRYVRVYSNSGVVLSTTTFPVDGTDCLIGEIGGYEDRFVVVYSNTNTVFRIYDTDGTLIVAETTLFTGKATDIGSIKPRLSGGFICVNHNKVSAGTGIYYRWGVVNNSGTVLHTGLIGSPSVTVSYCDFTETEDEIIFAYTNSTASLYVLGMESYSTDDYSAVTSFTTIATESNAPSFHNINVLQGGCFALTYAGSSYNKLLLLDPDWNIISTENLSAAGVYILSKYSNETFRFYIVYQTGTKLYLNIKGGFLTDWWTASASILFNGITFESNDCDYIYRLIYCSTGTFTMRWCELNDFTRVDYADDSYDLYPVISTATANIIANCKVYNCDAGFDITSDSVTANNNLIYSVSYSPAFKITGSGANIIFNHNTAFNNQIGLELVSNAGTEIIKNSIFSNNQTAVKAETSVLIKNSCIPDPLDNATYDSTSSTLNPLFISDGYVTTMDLHLQSKVLGYAFDSPALGIADDSKDAGCYDVTYTLNPASYTSFVIPKPKTIIPNITTVNKIVNVMQDGSVDIQVDAYQLEIALEWESVLKRYVSSIIKLFMAEGDIRIYFNPATYPTIYEEMKLVTKELPLNSDIYTLTDSGFNKFKLEFVRKFQLSELVD